MKKFFSVLIVVLGLAFSTSTLAEARTIDLVVGKVVAVLDGDTFDVLRDDKTQIRVRIGAIDAPEKSQPFGTRSREFLAHLIAGQMVLVRVHKLDRHESKHGKRRIGSVHLRDLDVGLEMVRVGYAWHYAAYESEQSAQDRHLYKARQAQAQHQQLGLWADPNPTPPWAWRRKGQ